MRKIVIGLVVGSLLLSGCASVSERRELNIDQLQHERYFRGSDVFLGDFVSIQRNLVQSTQACHTAYQWSLVANEVHYATVLYQPHAESAVQDSVLLYLTSYSSGKIQAEAFTYYAALQSTATDVLQWIQKPTSCPTFPAQE